MFKLEYFKAGYFKSKYFRGKSLEDTLEIYSYFETEVNWVSYNKNTVNPKLHISELAVNNKISDNLELFVSTFSIKTEESVSECFISELISVTSIDTSEVVSYAGIDMKSNNDDEEVIMSLIMAGLI